MPHQAQGIMLIPQLPNIKLFPQNVILQISKKMGLYVPSTRDKCDWEHFTDSCWSWKLVAKQILPIYPCKDISSPLAWSLL